MKLPFEYVMAYPGALRPEQRERLRQAIETAIGERTLVLEQGLVLQRFPLPPGNRRYQRIIMVG